MILLLLLFGLMFLLKSSFLSPFSNPLQSISISIGFILIFAFLFGKKISRFNVPQITGFILAGMLCGPYLLGFLGESDVDGLQLLDGLALSLIALTAGGEIRIKRLKESMRSITGIVVFQTVIIIAGFLAFGLVGHSLFAFFSGMALPHVIAVSLLLGCLATATSPASTIAVITETRAKGKYTDLVLSTAVVKDFFVICLFAFVLSFSKSLVFPAEGFDLSFLIHILKEIGGSVLLGFLIGIGIILYVKIVKRDLIIFILSIAFFTYQISQSYGYHPLLICLVAGFLVQNFSAHGESLISAIERSSTPVYVIFFAISGASLDLSVLQTAWVLILACVVWRGVLKFLGTYFGAKFAREEQRIQRSGWTGFISQAGVTLGMAVIIENTFPEWGGSFKALALGIIAVNQILGPVLLQRFLFKVGEAKKLEER
jgi:Kef-type K+ transport system membrane component KefB